MTTERADQKTEAVKFNKTHEEKFLEFSDILELNEEDLIDFGVGLLMEYVRSLKEGKYFCSFEDPNPEGKYFIVNFSDLIDFKSFDLSEIDPKDYKYFINDFLNLIENNNILFFDIIIKMLDFYTRHYKDKQFGFYSETENTLEPLEFQERILN